MASYTPDLQLPIAGPIPRVMALQLLRSNYINYNSTLNSNK